MLGDTLIYLKVILLKIMVLFWADWKVKNNCEQFRKNILSPTLPNNLNSWNLNRLPKINLKAQIDNKYLMSKYLDSFELGVSHCSVSLVGFLKSLILALQTSRTYLSRVHNPSPCVDHVLNFFCSHASISKSVLGGLSECPGWEFKEKKAKLRKHLGGLALKTETDCRENQATNISWWSIYIQPQC